MATGLDLLLSDGGASAPQSGLDILMSGSAPPKPKVLSTLTPTPKPSMMDVIGNGLVKGAAGFGDMLPHALVNVANLGVAGYGYAKGQLTGSTDLPDLIPDDALSGFKKTAEAAGAINPANEPQGGMQRVADFTAQVLGGGGVNPRSVLRAAGGGRPLVLARDLVTPIIGGVAGGSVAEGVRDNVDPETWYGRAAAATLPALAQFGASSVTARANTAGERAAQTTKTVTPQQWQAASDLAKKAQALGSPISAPEAIQALTGTNPGLATLQRVTEQSTHGVNTLAPAYAQRPQQNKNLFNQVADGIYPNETDPGAIAGTMQRAATGAIDNARGQGNAAASPFYAKSSNDPSVTVPSHDWNALSSDPAVAWALEQTKKSPLLGVQGAQAGSLQWLDAAKKYLDGQSAKHQLSGENFEAGQAGKASKLITSTVDPISPDYAKARGIVAANMRNVVEPMEAGQVGKLSGSNDMTKQAGDLLPENPMDVTPAVVAKTAQTIGAQDPTIMQRFAAQYLRGTFNNADQSLQNGPNQFGGAKFAAKIAGNETQGQNLTQLLSSSGANPMGLQDALSVWRAQGTRPAPGSMTSFNNGEHGLLSGEGSFAAMVGKPLALPGLLMNKLNYGAATKDLSAAIKPDGMTVERFKELARANGAYSPMEQAKFAALLRASYGAGPASPDQPPPP